MLKLFTTVVFMSICTFGSEVLEGKNAQVIHSFIQDVKAIIEGRVSTTVAIPGTVGVSSSIIADLDEKLIAFYQADEKTRTETFSATFKELTDIIDQDPVSFSFLNSDAVVALVPYCSETELKQLVTLGGKTITAGAPADGFLQSLEKASQAAKDDLKLTYKFMLLYSNLEQKDQVMALFPSLARLQAIDDLEEADPWLKLLKQHSTKNFLDLCFALQSKSLPMEDRIKMAQEIAALCSKADEDFMDRWFKSISVEPLLLEALKSEVENQYKKIVSSKDFKERATALASSVQLVNTFSEVEPEASVSRVVLRHWGLEYACSLANYKKNTPAVYDRRGRERKPAVITCIDFKKLVKNLPSDKTLSVLSEAEKELYQFQKNVALIKTGLYNEKALDILISYKDKYPESVGKYCSEFFINWANNVNPNKTAKSQNQYTNYGYYYSGGTTYIQEPSGIPLTRSRQMKNLQNCSAMFKKVYQAGLKVDPAKQIKAFTACFSQAEVITEDDIRLVFQDLAPLTDDMLVQITDYVVQQLQSNWMNKEARQRLQTAYRTSRSEEQVKEEIVKAYGGIINIMAQRLAKNSASIELNVRLAAAYFDFAEFKYKNELCTLEEYTELRDKAFSRFDRCATLYEEWLEQGKTDYTIVLYRNWFSVILGASNLNTLAVSRPVSNIHLDKLQKSLFGMNEKWRQRHINMFGAWVTATWPGLQPNVKLSFLESVKEIMGPQPSIAAIDEQLALYQSFLTEIKLVAKIDGSSDIGSKSEFGMLLSIQHTPELEREANGFSKYVRNQVSIQGQRQPIDYQKNFANNINKALQDKFEVNGLSWLDGAVRSQESAIIGWRETPLVYVKLKAKDSSVDKVPSIQLDVDFNDGAGKVVLPVVSNAVLVNSMQGRPRPTENVEIEMVLDARGANDGKVSLEVKVTGEGMLPNLARMLVAAEGYKLTNISDASPLILRLDQVGNDVVPKSELTTDLKVEWTGKLEKFTFPKLLTDGVKVLYKQYSDADIVPAEETVYISNASASYKSFYLFGAAALVLVLLVSYVVRKKSRQQKVGPYEKFKKPQNVSAISALRFLHQIRHSNHALAAHAELQRDIKKIEQCFFAKTPESSTPDLGELINNWHAKVN